MSEESRVERWERTSEVPLLLLAVAFLVAYAWPVLDPRLDPDGANINSAGGALWWAATTVTTVGYGDRYPVTTAGRLIAVVLMLVGIAVVSSLTAVIASWLVENVREEARDGE